MGNQNIHVSCDFWSVLLSILSSVGLLAFCKLLLFGFTATGLNCLATRGRMMILKIDIEIPAHFFLRILACEIFFLVGILQISANKVSLWLKKVKRV